MDSIVLDGITYIKTAKAAKLAGYTADYVGQLCRENEIDCKKIGRSWYVSEAELLAHKRDAKRSSRIKARKEVHKAVEEVKSKNLGVHSSLFIHTGGVKKSEIQYETDPHDLIPTPQKSVKNDVKHSDYEKTKFAGGITITKIQTPEKKSVPQQKPKVVQSSVTVKSTPKTSVPATKPKTQNRPTTKVSPLPTVKVATQKSEPNVLAAICVIGIVVTIALLTLEGVTTYDVAREDGKTRSSVHLQGHLQEYLDHAARTVYTSANSFLGR